MGTGTPLPIPSLHSFSLPLYLRCPLPALVFGDLEVVQLHWGAPLCLGSMFPRRAKGSHCAFKAKLNVSRWQARGDSCLPAQALVTCARLH